MKESELYFASPLFCDSEKEYNERLVQEIESIGYTVFLPQRDGFEFVKLTDLSSDEKGKLIRDTDRERVRQSEVIVAILDGRVPDEGVVTEIAWAREDKEYGGNKNHIVGLKTDVRVKLPDSDDGLNPLIRWNLDTLVYSREDLLTHLRAIYSVELPAVESIANVSPGQ